MKLSSGLVVGALSLVVTAVGTAAAQAPSDDELRAIASCRDIPKSKDRLRCFERTTEILQPFAPFAAADTDKVADAEAPSATVASAAPLSAYKDENNGADAVASFGAEDLVQEDEEKRIKELRAVAIAVSQNKRGKYIIELDNGQVWRQLPGDSNKLRFRRNNDGGHEVIIKKRSLGSYALRTTTAKRSILVRRIK